jgi:hypothetical protein
MVAQRLIAVPRRPEHRTALATDACSFVIRLADSEILLTTAEGANECDRLEKIGVLDAAQNLFMGHHRLGAVHLPLSASAPPPDSCLISWKSIVHTRYEMLTELDPAAPSSYFAPWIDRPFLAVRATSAEPAALWVIQPGLEPSAT